MGKVGSRTVGKYFRDKKMCMWHIHRFYDTPIHAYNRKNLIIKYTDLFILKIILMFCKKIYIVSGVRNVLDRDVSMFFHVAAEFYNVNFQEANLEELKDVFRREFPMGHADSWFDMEMKKSFGIDIFETAFNKEAAYQIYERKNFKVFIYNLNRLNFLETELANFFGLKNYQLININQSEKKIYNNKYLLFRKNYSEELKKDYESFTRINDHFL